MGALKLVSPGPDKVYAVRANPEPDWSTDGLLFDLNTLEEKLQNKTSPLVYLTKCHQRIEPHKHALKLDGKAFRMKIEDGDEEEDSETDDKGITSGSGIFSGNRFGLDTHSCDDYYDDGSEFGNSNQILEEKNPEKGSLLQLRQEFQNSLKEQIRTHVALFETELLIKREISESAVCRIENYILKRKESERKLDTEYKQLIVDAIAKHIAALQRDHNLRSQIEEKKLKSDVDEARKRAIALEEERIRVEKAEEKARAEKEAKLAALNEAENKKPEDIPRQITSSPPIAESPIETHKPTEKVVLASTKALRVEQKRAELLMKFEQQKKLLNTDFAAQTREIRRLVKQIRPLQQSANEKANSIINIITNPSVPQPISLLTFAENVVENCEKVNPFACAHVISLVASKVPQVVDLIFAVLHRSCTYTVPKHVPFSKTAFPSKEAYYKELGYLQDGDRFEPAKDFLNRVKLYTTLYGAIVQMEGMESQGWAWLAMLINSVPANRYSAFAACGFLEAAGFGLFVKYKGQFRKLMRVFREEFLRNLRSVDDSEVVVVIAQLQAYVDGECFTQEPTGRRLQTHFISHDVFPQ